MVPLNGVSNSFAHGVPSRGRAVEVSEPSLQC